MKRLIEMGVIACMALMTESARAASASDANWPTWRGPNMSGIAVQGNPPTTWSETENIRWKVDVPGLSTSSPIIWGDQIVFQTAIDTGRAPEESASAASESGGRGGFRMSRAPKNIQDFRVVSIRLKDGSTNWSRSVAEVMPHEGHHPDHGFASYSPVTDGEKIWANFGSRGLFCLNMKGEILWSRELPKLVTRAGFGEGSSANLAGEAVIVVADHEGPSKIFAFHKDTGQPLWEKDRDEGTSWGTPVPIEVNGRLQVIVNGNKRIRGYDAQTGEVVWECGGMTENVVPSPVLGFGMVFCASGFRGSALLAIELGRTGDLTGSDAVKWQVDRYTPYVPSPLLLGRRLYFGSTNDAELSCYEADTGKELFSRQRLEGLKGLYASPVGVGDRVYVAGRNGVTQVLKSADTFEVIATNTLDDAFDASPAIVGDQLILKGLENVYCIAAQ